jgi:hypothetical protein
VLELRTTRGKAIPTVRHLGEATQFDGRTKPRCGALSMHVTRSRNRSQTVLIQLCPDRECRVAYLGRDRPRHTTVTGDGSVRLVERFFRCFKISTAKILHRANNTFLCNRSIIRRKTTRGQITRPCYCRVDRVFSLGPWTLAALAHSSPFLPPVQHLARPSLDRSSQQLAVEVGDVMDHHC